MASDYDFGDVSHDTSAPARAAPTSSSFDPVGTALAAGKGALKGAIEPFTGNIPNEDKKSPVVGWVERTDPAHSTAEGVGRIAGEVAPLAALPDIEVPALLGRAGAAVAARAAPYAGKLYQGAPFAARSAASKVPGMAMSALDRLVNWGWKGAVGGASQAPNDRAGGAETGAEFGVGSQIARKAVQSIPHPRFAAPTLAGSLPFLAYLAWENRNAIRPWMAMHATREALPGIAAALGPFLPPGVTGALGARAGQPQPSNDDGPQNHP